MSLKSIEFFLYRTSAILEAIKTQIDVDYLPNINNRFVIIDYYWEKINYIINLGQNNLS